MKNQLKKRSSSRSNSSFESSTERSQDVEDEISSLIIEVEDLIHKDSVRAFQILEKAQQLRKATNITDSRILRVSAYLNHYICDFNKSLLQSIEALKIFQQELKAHQQYQSNKSLNQDKYQIDGSPRLQSNSEEDENILKEFEGDILFILGESLFYLGRIESADKVFNRLIQIKMRQTQLFSMDQVHQKISIIDHIRSNSIQSNARTEEKKKECQQEMEKIQKKMEECEDNNYMNEHGLPVYLIPARWFSKWQDFVGWAGTKSQKPQSNTSKLGIPEFEAKEIAYEFEYPGEIECGDILENYPKTTFQLGIDPDKVKSFCNLVLKRDLQESQHFIVLPVPVGEILMNKYGGIRIKRLILSLQDDSSLSQVEIRPVCIRFMAIGNLRNEENYVNNKNESQAGGRKRSTQQQNSIMNTHQDSQNEELKIINKTGVTNNPNDVKLKKSSSLKILDTQILKTYMSKKETIISLKSKLIRIILNRYSISESLVPLINKISCKLWRTDDTINLKSLAKAYEKRECSQVYINAKLIDNSSVPIEEAEIAEQDIIIVELAEQNDFVLQNESELLVAKVCGCCGKKEINLSYCECMLIMYCDQKCQKKHRPKHRGICKQTKAELQSKKEMLNKFNIKMDRKQIKKSINGICGLKNLGNTCFMNSSLQCLSNVQEMTEYMLQNKFLHDLNRQNPLGTGGYLAASYAELIKDLWTGSDKSTSPWNLKKTIGKFAPQFSGYNQQDSHELLSYLLDGIHEDLNRVKIKPLVNQVESDGKNDLDAALRSWDNYQKRNRSPITDLFVGQYKSTLICPRCQKVSVTFDPYMTISLPVPSVAYTQITIYVVPRESKILQSWKLSIKRSETIGEIKEKVKNELGLNNRNELIACYQTFSQDFDCTTLQDSLKIEQILNQIKNNNCLFFFQSVCQQEIDSDVPKNRESQIVVKLQIRLWDKKERKFKTSSFSRVFVVGQNTSFQVIHLKAWQMLRICMQGDSNQELSIAQLKEEYEEVLEKYGGENGERHQLYLQDKFLIDYSADKSLGSEFEQIKMQKSQIELGFTLLHGIFDKIQLNFCEEKSDYIKSSQPKNSFNLHDSLSLFVQKEVLEKGNEWYCAQCKDHVQATKQLQIFSTPKILIIHIKRFKTVRYGGNMFIQSGGVKLDEYIDFPLKGLDLSSFTQLHQIEKQNNFKQANQFKYEPFPSEDLKSTADSSTQKEKDPLLYDLFSVSNHYGTLSGGHYTAFAQNFKNNKWYHFNDSEVTEIRESEVTTKAAYLLFYKRRDKNASSNTNFEDYSLIRSGSRLNKSTKSERE